MGNRFSSEFASNLSRKGERIELTDAAGRRVDAVKYLALTFGMTGDTDPQDGGSWRPPGWFSGPLLANPEFRKVLLARTRHILETVYTEAPFGPVLDHLAKQRRPEVGLRAEIQGQDPSFAVGRLESDLARRRQHLRQRREFLLDQVELKRTDGAR